MRWLSRTIFLVCLLNAALQPTVCRAEVVASLLTVGPGDEVWEKFGHNMIRFQDQSRGIDVAYNWGLFDFDKPNFIWNFIQGRPIYTMAPMGAAQELALYQSQNRRVTSQVLKLTPEQVNDLIRRCAINFRDHPDYRYDYFKDNCSTRVRDMIDGVTREQLSALMRGRPTDPTQTYRTEMVRLTQTSFWVSLGMDFALGPNGDKSLDLWADGFLPETVAKAATAMTEPRVELWPVTRAPEPAAVPTRWPWLLLAGLAGGGAIVGLMRWRRWAGVLAISLWWLVSGLGGVFMLFLWTVTDHVAGYANQNLWCYSPSALIGMLLLVIRKRRAAVRLAAAIVTLSCIGTVVWIAGKLLGGPIAQPNGGFILLALPLNLAAAWATKATLTKPAAADEVTGL